MDQPTVNHLITQSFANGITERQMECLGLVAKGLTSKQIARELGISPSTVDNHIRAAMGLTGAPNRIEAARRVLNQNTESAHAKDVDLRRRPLINDANFASKPPNGIHFLRLPPIGGYRNNSSILQRFVYVAQIALLATMIFAALTATIAGIVNLFAR